MIGGNNISGKRPRRSAAFTLVELLAVIAVTAILATLLLAVLGRARARAELASCVSNMRQVHSGLMMLATEDGNKIDTFSGGAGGVQWTQKLKVGNGTFYEPRGYIPDATVCRCPSYLDTITDSFQLDNINWPWVSYGLNMFATDPEVLTETIENESGGAIGGRKIVMLSNISDPANFVLLADSIDMNQNMQTFRLLNNPRYGVHFRHDGKANVVFLDGHAETIGPERINELGLPYAYDINGKRITGTLIN